jgi:membrane protein implicated in regulation of membrane protease activity
MLVIFTLGTAIVVGAIIALATGYWWVLALAVLVHLSVTAFVMWFIFRRLDEHAGKPDPTTEARIEAS